MINDQQNHDKLNLYDILIMFMLKAPEKGSEIGGGNKTGRFIWLAYLDCGKERWVRFVDEHD